MLGMLLRRWSFSVLKTLRDSGAGKSEMERFATKVKVARLNVCFFFFGVECVSMASTSASTILEEL